jgi:hypothetical protein
MTGDARNRRRRATWPRPLAVAVAVLTVTSLACGGATGPDQGGPDPDVRGVLSGYFIWATVEPTLALGSVEPAVADDIVGRAEDTIEPDRDVQFGISIVASFATADEAQEHAAAARDVLAASARWYDDPANAAALAQLNAADRAAPMTPPERAALEAQLLAPGDRGMGWGGTAEAVDDAVYTLGPVLVVTGLKSETETDADLGTELPIHPLAHLLAAAGGQVFLEGDRSGEGSIVADVSCRPADPASGTALLDELGDSILTAGQFSTRPPWIGPPPTAEQALARATYRRWQHAGAAALGDSRFQEMALQLAHAPVEKREAAMDELQAYLRQRGIELLDGEIDPDVLALILDIDVRSDDAARQAWVRAVGERMGRLPVQSTAYGDQPAPDDSARLPNSGTVRLKGDRLEMGWLMFGRLAAGLPSLAGYLTARGCDDIRIGLVDFDDVRGD